MSAAFEEKMRAAVRDGVVPGVVMLARGKSDSPPPYVLAVGNPSALPGHASVPISASSTIFTLMSLSKLATAIVVLQAVDAGVLPGLDEDVTSLIPELAAQSVFTGTFSGGGDSGQPDLRPRTRPITLRHLLTHSSGAGYANLDDNLAKARLALTGLGPYEGATFAQKLDFPLLFEPGEGWRYGSGVDWAGRAAERAWKAKRGGGEDDDVTLEALLQQGVAKPLGITTMTFFPADELFEPPTDPGTASGSGEKLHMAGVSVRDPASGRAVDMGLGPGMGATRGAADAMGGQGLHATMADYFKMVESLLLDDGKLLRPEMAKLLFEPLLPTDAEGRSTARDALNAEFETQTWAVGNWYESGHYDWSAAGIVLDKEGGQRHRKKGAAMWAGMLNLSWFIDREAGVAGVFATQMMPPVEEKVAPLIRAFEEEMYARFATPSA